MFCPNCGTKNEDNAKFCFKCGTPLEVSNEVKKTSCDELKSQMMTKGFVLLEESETTQKWKNFDTGKTVEIEKIDSEWCQEKVKESFTQIKFLYKPKVTLFLISILLFGIAALVFGNNALNNDRGLILNGVIEFSVVGATIFYWCLTIISGLFVVSSIFLLIAGLVTKKEIILTENEISAPIHFLSKKNTSIKYSEIIDMNIQSVNNQKFLNILYQDGKITIIQSMLSSNEMFEELVNLLSLRING